MAAAVRHGYQNQTRTASNQQPKTTKAEENTMAQFQIGSISTGTLKTEDLIEAFNHALTDMHHGYWLDINELMSEGADQAAMFNKQPTDEQLQAWVLDRLMEELQAGCPPFVYFGTLPGDGADFGFWPDWNALEECQHDGEGEHVCRSNSAIIQINDHGNVTVMDMDRNVLWSVV